MEETIENRARLVKLKIRKWTARKYDENIGISVALKVNNNAKSDTLGRFNKVLIPEKDGLGGLYGTPNTSNI